MKYTRGSYLKELNRCIQALPVEEQEEAMDYYNNYFDDADDDEKVIDELGSPEELAEVIKEKFACVPTETKKQPQQDESQGSSFSDATALKFNFSKNAVKNLDLSLGAARIVMITGSEYSVETRGIEPASFRCVLSQQGTLIVDNAKAFPTHHFWGHDNPRNWTPRILLTVPENADLDIVKINVGAGSFTTEKVALKCNVGVLNVSAGNLAIDKLVGGRVDLRCGMGNLSLKGKVTGISNIDCGMGNITVKLSGDEEDYSFDAKVGLGDIRVNDKKKSGIGTVVCSARKENHFSVNCGLGSVQIKIR